ncbi:unnamed protein product [Dicrocoelium dendriticum]|nr:unnamed protein product [Dicrocoelium dendriticum]
MLLVSTNCLTILSPPEIDPYFPTLDDTPEISDPETAEALAEFELFVSQQKVNGRISSNLGESTISTLSENASNLPPVYQAWDSMDEKELMNRFKEKYHAKQFRDVPLSKEDRILWRSSSPSGGPGGTGQSEFEYQLGALSAGEDIDVKRPPESIYSSPTTSFSIDELEEAARDYDSVLSTSSSSHSQQELLTNSSLQATMTTIGSKTPLPIVSSVPASIGLGDLASLTVANESDPGHLQNVAAAMDNLDGVCVVSHPKLAVDESSCSRISTSPSVETAPWTAKYTLRSHFDAIRSIKFHPTEPMLVTASEDHTVKLWNLNKTVQAKKSNNFDVEPVYTFRGHNAPVLSLSMVTQPESSGSFSLVVFSGDLHGNLRSWRLSNLHWDPYDTFDPTVNGPLLRGHSDAIWSLVTRPDGYLLSVSADGTACLWPTDLACALHPPSSILTGSEFKLTTTLMTALATRSVEFGSMAPVPTSVDFVQTDRNHFVAGFTSGHVGLFDIETNQLISTFYSTESSPNEVTSPALTAVTCVLSHPLHSLAVSAFEDRHIRFFDTNSGNCTHTMVAHLDAVTSLDVDPHGICLISGSHDCSIRLWNINKKTCIQEITSHRKKFGESIHAVAFHPSKHLMASAGSDALAKVFV